MIPGAATVAGALVAAAAAVANMKGCLKKSWRSLVTEHEKERLFGRTETTKQNAVRS